VNPLRDKGIHDPLHLDRAEMRRTPNSVQVTHSLTYSLTCSLTPALCGLHGRLHSTSSGANIDCGLVTAPTWTGVVTKCNQNLSVLIGFFGIP
jgi:hypothetical protein